MITNAGRRRLKQRLNKQHEDRAAWFVARLYSGEMTVAEDIEMQRWLAEDPKHREDFERVLRLWDVSGDLSDDSHIASAIEAAGRPRTHSKTQRRWFGLAAVMLVTVLAGVVGKTLLESPDSAQIYQTDVGDQQTHVLPDGSRVTLNTASRILVDFNAVERRIMLDFGEIFLDVEKDPERFLTIKAGDRVIAVIGTKFSVLLAGDRLEVAVAEGTLAVGDEWMSFQHAPRSGLSLRDDSLILGAGAVARFADDGQIVEEGKASEVERLQSWRNGLVRFEKQPLMRVISEVNRYASVKILIEDSRIADLQISAVLHLDQVEMSNQIELLLSSLEDIHPIKVVRHPDRFVLVADGTTG